MSHSKLQGYEDVDVDGVCYVFKSDFSFLAELKQVTGVDPLQIYQRFAEDEGDPDLVRDVLRCSLVSISGKEVEPEKRQSIAEDLITLKGLQETVILAQYLLSYAMIGDKKKSQMRTMEQNQTILDALSPSPWKNSRNHLLLWGYVALISGLCACLNFKLYGLLIASPKG